jgi:hypothetical protein
MTKMKYVELGFATADAGFAQPPEGAVCSDCGWPIKKVSTAIKEGKKADGSLRYKHVMCPSLKQRAEMRRAALVQS